MKFPMNLRFAKGDDLRTGLLRWRSVANAKGASLRERFSWLYNEDRPLYDVLQDPIDSLDWIFTQIAEHYLKAYNACGQVRDKLDGNGGAEATQADMLAVLEMDGATSIIQVLTSLAVNIFSEEISPKLVRYPDLRHDIDQTLIWD